MRDGRCLIREEVDKQEDDDRKEKDAKILDSIQLSH